MRGVRPSTTVSSQPGGRLDLTMGNEQLLAGALAATVAWRSRNVVATVRTGVLARWVPGAKRSG